MQSRLHRSRSDAMLGGVCSGLARYFNLDPTIVRLIFVLLAFVSIGVLLYLVLWFILPTEGSVQTNGSGFSSDQLSSRAREFGKEVSDVFVTRRENTIKLIGIGLIAFGIFALMRIFIPGVFQWIDRLTGPAILIVVGGFLLYFALKKSQS